MKPNHDWPTTLDLDAYHLSRITTREARGGVELVVLKCFAPQGDYEIPLTLRHAAMLAAGLQELAGG